MARDSLLREGICQYCMKEEGVITIDADPPLSLCSPCMAGFLNALPAALRTEAVEHWDEWSRKIKEERAREAAANAGRKRSIGLVHKVPDERGDRPGAGQSIWRRR